MALTGCRPAEIFFSAKFSQPQKKLHYPAVIFDGQFKTRQAPGTSFEPYQSPAIDDPGDEIGRRFAYQPRRNVRKLSRRPSFNLLIAGAPSF